jgi:hypothetical protein
MLVSRHGKPQMTYRTNEVGSVQLNLTVDMVDGITTGRRRERHDIAFTIQLHRIEHELSWIMIHILTCTVSYKYQRERHIIPWIRKRQYFRRYPFRPSNY